MEQNELPPSDGPGRAEARPRTRSLCAFCFTLCWMVVVLLRFCFHHEIGNRLFIFVLGLDGVLLALALAIGIVNVVQAWRRRAIWGRIAQVLAVGGLVYGAWFTPLGSDFGSHCWLWRREASYNQIVQAILAKQAVPDTLESRRPYHVDAGPPLRVAFVCWRGFAPDNWGAIVYDPTGLVLRANEIPIDIDAKRWELADPAAKRARMLFGGGIVYARHIRGHWYYCQFS